MRIYIPKIDKWYPFLIYSLVIFVGKGNIGNTPENIKCGHLKKNMVIYHNEEKVKI